MSKFLFVKNLAPTRVELNINNQVIKKQKMQQQIKANKTEKERKKERAIYKENLIANKEIESVIKNLSQFSRLPLDVYGQPNPNMLVISVACGISSNNIFGMERQL